MKLAAIGFVLSQLASNAIAAPPFDSSWYADPIEPEARVSTGDPLYSFQINTVLSNSFGPPSLGCAIVGSSGYFEFESVNQYGCTQNSKYFSLNAINGALWYDNKPVSFKPDPSTGNLRLTLTDTTEATDRFDFKVNGGDSTGSLSFASDPSKCISYQNNQIILQSCSPFAPNNVQVGMISYQRDFVPDPSSPVVTNFKIFDNGKCFFPYNAGSKFVVSTDALPLPPFFFNVDAICSSSRSTFSLHQDGSVRYHGIPLTYSKRFGSEQLAVSGDGVGTRDRFEIKDDRLVHVYSADGLCLNPILSNGPQKIPCENAGPFPGFSVVTEQSSPSQFMDTSPVNLPQLSKTPVNNPIFKLKFAQPISDGSFLNICGSLAADNSIVFSPDTGSCIGLKFQRSLADGSLVFDKQLAQFTQNPLTSELIIVLSALVPVPGGQPLIVPTLTIVITENPKDGGNPLTSVCGNLFADGSFAVTDYDDSAITCQPGQLEFKFSPANRIVFFRPEIAQISTAGAESIATLMASPDLTVRGSSEIQITQLLGSADNFGCAVVMQNTGVIAFKKGDSTYGCQSPNTLFRVKGDGSMYFGNRAVIILTVPGSGVKVLVVSKSISSSDKFLLEGDDDSAKLVYKNDPSQCLVRAKAYIGLVPCQSSEAQVLPAVPFTVAAFEETKVISPQAKEFARFRIKNENNCAVGFNGGSNNIYLPTALSCSQSIGEFQIFEDGSLKLNGKPVTFSRGSKSVKLSTSNTQFTTEDKFRIASGKFLVLQDSFQLCLNFDGTNLVKKVCSSTGNVPIEFTFLAKDLSKWFADLSTMPVQKEATSRTPSIRLQMTQILTDDLTAKKFLGCAYVNSMGFVEMVRVDQFGCPDSSPVFRQRKDGTIWYGDKPLGFKTHPEKSMNGMQFLAVLDDLNEAKLFDSVASRGLTKSPLRLLAGISGPTTDVIVQQDSLITIADGRTFTANPSLILVGATIQQESFLPPTSLSPVIRFKLGDLAKSGCARSFSDGNNIVEISTIFNPISTQDQLDICLSSQSTFALMSDDSLTYNGKPVTFATSGGFGQANERNLAFSRSGFGTLDSFRTDISGNKMLRAAFLLNNLCFNLGFDGKFYQSNCGFASDSVNSFVPILLENGLASSRFTPFPLNILLLSYSGKTISNDNGPAGWARCAALHPSSEFVKFEEPALFYGCMNSLPMQITPEGVLLGAGRQLSFVADNSTDELRLAVNNSPISSTDRFGIKYGNLIYASDPSKCIAYQGNFIVLKDCPASYNPMGVLTAGVDPVVVSNLDSTLSGFQYPLFAPQMVSPRTGVVGAPIPFRIYDGFGCAYGKNLGTQFPIVFSAGDEQENCQSAKSLFYYFEGLVYYNNGYPLTIQASISGEISLAFSLTSNGGPNYNLVQENGLDYIVLPFGCFYRLPFGSIGIDTKRSECSAQTGTSNRLQIVIGEQFQVPNPVVPTSTPLPPFVTATLTQDPFTSTQLVTETVPGVDKTRTVVVYQTATLSLSTTVSEGFTKTVPTLVTVDVLATVTVDTTVIGKSTILKTETIYGTSTVTLNPATRTKEIYYTVQPY